MTMLSLEIPYDPGYRSLMIEERHLGVDVSPQEVGSSGQRDHLNQAIRQAEPLLSSLFAGPEPALVVINDATRPTPTAEVLTALRRAFPLAGFDLLVATGTHGPPTEEEYQKLLGPLYPVLRNRVQAHQSRDDTTMGKIGQTSAGTPVSINRRFLNARRVLIIGSVEPHYFAGFTGGFKGIVPGLASFETIRLNHELAMSLDAAPTKLTGNPVYADIQEAVTLIPPKDEMLGLMTVSDGKDRVAAAFCGDVASTFDQAVTVARDIYVVPVGHPADIVISVARDPLHKTLYQSQKPIEHGKMAVKRDGIVILVMPCPKGVGDQGFQDMINDAAQIHSLEELSARPYQLGFHRFIRNMQFLEQGLIFAVTNLQPAWLRRMSIVPMPSVQAAVDRAISLKGPEAKIHILRNGSLTVPLITQ
ncbi:MAG: nickel-dependent lactate racemase [Deltaproteobacteria bacterium]|nr:nickel-dependent lactate racemase [Deltaproteobacteria bacterium]